MKEEQHMIFVKIEGQAHMRIVMMIIQRIYIILLLLLHTEIKACRDLPKDYIETIFEKLLTVKPQN